MLKKMIAIFLCMLTLMGVVACGRQTSEAGGNKIKVMVSFNALHEFVQAVGQDKVDITTVIPEGTEPHDFEPKARDIEALGTADIFVYNGLGMEAWADEAIQAANNKDLIVVDASKSVDAITNTDEEEIQEHGQYDPHIWLSLKDAEIEARNISDALIQANPSEKDYFEKNCDDFISQLESLYSEYDAKFKTVSNKSIVTGHAAFAYLCRDFGLSQNSVEDVFAEGEPSAQQMTELVNYCRENEIKTIFMEEMVSPEVSQTLANEIGADVKTIYTIESSEDGMSYIERMKSNLEAIIGSLSR
jgi:zinc transport system substrate-binding protein